MFIIFHLRIYTLYYVKIILNRFRNSFNKLLLQTLNTDIEFSTIITQLHVYCFYHNQEIKLSIVSHAIANLIAIAEFLNESSSASRATSLMRMGILVSSGFRTICKKEKEKKYSIGRTPHDENVSGSFKDMLRLTTVHIRTSAGRLPGRTQESMMRWDGMWWDARGWDGSKEEERRADEMT